jgi:hypothetical protein
MTRVWCSCNKDAKEVKVLGAEAKEVADRRTMGAQAQPTEQEPTT